jgi:DnaJ-class molecular chaperone
MAKCRKCKGRGEVPAGGKFDGYEECPYCGGDGEDVRIDGGSLTGGVNSDRGPSDDWSSWG